MFDSSKHLMDGLDAGDALHGENWYHGCILQHRQHVSGVLGMLVCKKKYCFSYTFEYGKLAPQPSLQT